jgi:hypothetical protein
MRVPILRLPMPVQVYRLVKRIAMRQYAAVDFRTRQGGLFPAYGDTRLSTERLRQARQTRLARQTRRTRAQRKRKRERGGEGASESRRDRQGRD